MKFKNIEDVWAYAKNKLVNAQISSVQKTGSSKFFDMTIPKSMVKKFPEDCNRQDLNYTITQTGSTIDLFLENNGWEETITDTSDFFDMVLGWCGINESEQELNQNAIIGVESSYRPGFDKTITFSYYTTRADLEKQLKKIGKPFALDVLPSDEAEIHVKNADVDKFKGIISALHEKIDTGMNMSMMEGFSIKPHPVPDWMKQSDFESQEIKFINDVIGKTWYQIVPKSRAWKDADKLASVSKEIKNATYDGVKYTVYEAPKGTKFIYMSLGFDSGCYMFGQTSINEAQDNNPYKEFFEKKMKEWNITSPSQLSQQDRSKFFNEIRQEWKQQKNMSEGYSNIIRNRPLSKSQMDTFDPDLRKFIKDWIGNTWYVIDKQSDPNAFNSAKLMRDTSKVMGSKIVGVATYTYYDRYQDMEPYAVKFINMHDGYGTDKFIFGSKNLYESEAQDKYREFFENKLKQWNISSPAELTQQDRSKFFTEIRQEWKEQKNVSESFVIKGRPLPDPLKKDFSSQERDYINSVIGNTWYQVTPRSKVYKDAMTLAGKSKRIDHMKLGWFNYDTFEAPKGTKFIYVYDGYGTEAYMFGQTNINESMNLSANKVSDSTKTMYYNTKEINYINSAIGKTWYKVSWGDKEWSKCDKMTKSSKKTDNKVFGNTSCTTYQRNDGLIFVERHTTGYVEFYFGNNNISESFVKEGYEILDQAEFRQEFGGNSNLASYALYSLYNTRLIVKCTPSNPMYGQIRAKVETYPDVTANDKNGIKCYRQTASNLIIIYNDNIYWSYNTGTNLVLLNEAELVKGLGKIFDTLPDTGQMSDNAVRAAIQALGGTMSELSTNPTTNSIKAYKTCEDEYQCLINELQKRGLRPVNR